MERKPCRRLEKSGWQEAGPVPHNPITKCVTDLVGPRLFFPQAAAERQQRHHGVSGFLHSFPSNSGFVEGIGQQTMVGFLLLLLAQRTSKLFPQNRGPGDGRRLLDLDLSLTRFLLSISPGVSRRSWNGVWCRKKVMQKPFLETPHSHYCTFRCF